MIIATLAGAIALVLLFIKRRWIYILYKTLPRDLRAIVRFTKLNRTLWWWNKQNQTIPKIFVSLAKKHPHKVAFYYENEKWTFSELDKYTNRIGSYFKEQGFRRGDTIALLLENRPEYVGIWLGLSKIGVVTALINTNLVNDPLLHAINVANSKAVIFGTDFAKAIKGVSEKLKTLKLYQFEYQEDGEKVVNAVNLIKDVTNVSERNLENEVAVGDVKDSLIYIYTSGTTGLPKAAIITHSRFMFMVSGIHFMTALRDNDVLYDPLPLYHSAGGMLGVGQTLLHGITVVIRKKFSASGFWKDCIKYQCTAAQYIGEICRYLLAVPETENSMKHSVRTMFGNGLKPQIWSNFVNRFHVKELYELYGATEGNSNLINIDSTPGAVGFVPVYAGTLYPVCLVKCDEATGEPIRNENGFCTRCQPDEPGVFLGKINPKNSARCFQGYADKKATESKILVNVFKRGDMYYNSGDILVQDEFGYYYFRDRTGDTFRWKGENVSTSEVEAVISNITNLTDAVVYGVQIPGTEGRAGMAAIVDTDSTLDLDHLCKQMKANLPAYAFPIFIRILETMPLTGTFKLKKIDLQKEGYDISRVKDDIYFYDAKQNAFKKLTKEVYDDIVHEKMRL